MAGVRDGALTASKYVRLAVDRQYADLKHAESRGYVFSEDIAADHCLWITKHCKHSKGEFAGRSFVLSDNQLFIVWTLFGWRCADDGTRRFREAYITCGRKWGKSEFCSALACKVTAEDEPREPGAVNLAVATKEAQAKDLIFEQSRRMVRRSPRLSGMLNVAAKSITSPDEPGAPQRASVFAPVGSDSDTNDGHDSHVVFIDELHAWGARHVGLYERMNTSGGSRRQPLTIVVTTAGDTRSFIWKRRDNFCCNVMDAFSRGDHIGDEHFVFIARFDKDDDPLDEANWPKANPNYPTTPKPRYLRQQASKAKSDPVEMNTFLRFHGNVEVSSTEKAIPDEVWTAAKGELSDWSEAVAIGGGLDGGGAGDLASVGECAKFETGDEFEGRTVYRYEIRQKSWRSDCTDTPFADLVGSGLEEDPYPLPAAESHMLKRAEDGVGEWASDPYSTEDLRQRFERDHGVEVIKMPQLYSHYNEPMAEFLRALHDGRVTHDGDKTLAWAASNLHAKPNGRGEMMPDREKSSDKIDPIVAVLMAFRMAYFASDAGASFYEDNELEIS